MSAEFADDSSSSLFFGPLFVDNRFVECNEVSREIQKLKAEQECKQKRTFTKWINAQLRTHWSKTYVVDLYVDIRTGVMLCYLVETVTDRKLTVNASRKMKRIHHISNFNMVLSVLRQYGLELVNNNPVDLANGNPPIVLGLIWQIILHFEIKRTVLWLLKNDDSGVIQNAGELSVEKWLLQWLRNEIAGKYGTGVDDLDNNWKDGVLFNALIHHADPTLVDMSAVRRNSDGRGNLEHAFAVAEQRLNIPRLLDLDDVDCEQPDKRSIMTYLVQFLRKTADQRANNSKSGDYNSGIIHIKAAGENEEEDIAAIGPLGGPLCREDISHQLRIIQMWLETTNAFLARQTATAAALNEQIDAIMNHQAQMPQIEHVLLFIEHAPKLLRSDEASTDLAVTKRQYHSVTKPAIPAKLRALKLIKPQLSTLDEKWAKLTKCLKHVADIIEADEDLHIINGDLKEIAEELTTAQVLTDSICQQQNEQHVNAPIIMEKTRHLCTQFDLLKVQLSGQVVEEELASFQVAEQAITELIDSFEQEIQDDSRECTSDMRARAPSFALISTYPVLFNIGRVNSEMIGKIEKMKQAVEHVSDKNKSSVEDRIASVERKWARVLEQLNAFNDRVRQQMKKDEHLASCRSQYDICRNELEYRLDRFEQLFAKQKHLRKSQIFLQVTDAHTDLKQQEKMFGELEGLKQLLLRQRQLLANLSPLITNAELAEAKQEIVGFELRLDMQCEEFREHIAKRSAGLSLISETGQWIRSVCDGRGTAVVGGARKELLKTLISEAEGRMAQFSENEPDETVRLLATQAEQRLQSVHDDLKQQLALVEYNEWFLVGIDRQLEQLREWTETTLTVCRATPVSPRSAVHLLEHVERLIAQLPSEYRKFLALKTGCPSERTDVVQQLADAFNDIRTKLIAAQHDLSRYIESCDYLAQTAQWLNATEYKLASLELVAEMDVFVAFEVLNDVRKDMDDRRSTVDALVEQQPATEYPAATIRQRMSLISGDRLAQCESTLNRKLDMFQQLEQLAEFYQLARRRESALGIVPVNQTMMARVENSSLARELNGTLNSVGELQTEVDSLEAKFFQVECDRIRERFYYVIGQLRQILDRCDRREEYFETLSNVPDLTSVLNTDDETAKQRLLRDHSTSSTVTKTTSATDERKRQSNESAVDNTAKLPRFYHSEEAAQLRVESEQENFENISRWTHDKSPSRNPLQSGKPTSFSNDNNDISVEFHIKKLQNDSAVHCLSAQQRFLPVSELGERSKVDAAVLIGSSGLHGGEERQHGTFMGANVSTNTSLPESTNSMVHHASSERFAPPHGLIEKNKADASAASKSHRSEENRDGNHAFVNESTDGTTFQSPTADCALAKQRHSPAAELVKKPASNEGSTALESQEKQDAKFIHNSTEDSVAYSTECLLPRSASEMKNKSRASGKPLESGEGRHMTSESMAQSQPQIHIQASEVATSNGAEINDEGRQEDGTFVRATESAEGAPPEQNALITTLCTEFTTIMMTIHEHIENFTQRMKKPNVTQAELQEGMKDLINGQENVRRIRRSIPSVTDGDGDELRRLVDRELAAIGQHVETFHKIIDEMNLHEGTFDDQLGECSNRIAQLADEKEKLELVARTTTDRGPENWKQLAASLAKAQEELQNIRTIVAELAANSQDAHTACLVGILQADLDQHSNDFQMLENQVQAQLIASKGYQEVADNLSTLHQTLTAASAVLNDESAAPADFDSTLQKLQRSRDELDQVERAYKEIPTNSQNDELRAKLAWDLSKQRECLNKLAASLQDRCQLYVEHREQLTAAHKELDDIEALISSDNQTKKRKGKKRKDLPKKEQIEQTEKALARLTAHEETFKDLRRLANSLLPTKAPMTAVEQIESKNAALYSTCEERLALLGKSDAKSQSSGSNAEAETTKSSQRESSAKQKIMGVIKKTLASAGISKTDSNDDSSSYTPSKKVVGGDPTMKAASENADFTNKIINDGPNSSTPTKVVGSDPEMKKVSENADLTSKSAKDGSSSGSQSTKVDGSDLEKKKASENADLTSKGAKDGSSSSTHSTKVVGSDPTMKTSSENADLPSESKSAQGGPSSSIPSAKVVSSDPTASKNASFTTKIANDGSSSSTQSTQVVGSDHPTMKAASENADLNSKSKRAKNKSSSSTQSTKVVGSNPEMKIASENAAFTTKTANDGSSSSTHSTEVVGSDLAMKAASKNADLNSKSKSAKNGSSSSSQSTMAVSNDRTASNNADFTTKPANDGFSSSTQSTQVVGSDPGIKTASKNAEFITKTASIMKSTDESSSKQRNEFNEGELAGLTEEHSTDAIKESNKMGSAKITNFEDAKPNYDISSQRDLPTKAADAASTAEMSNEEKTAFSVGLRDQRVGSLSAKQVDGEKIEKAASKQGQQFIIPKHGRKRTAIEMDKENNAEYEIGYGVGIAENKYGSKPLLLPDQIEDRGTLVSAELPANSKSSNITQHISKKMAEPVVRNENGQLKKRIAKKRQVSFEDDIKSQGAHQLDNGINQNTLEQIIQHIDEEINCAHLASSADEKLDIVEVQVETETFPSRFSCRRYLCVLLPLLGLMFAVLFLALLLPYCEDDWCRWTNSFRRGFEPVVEFVDGPPPV